MMPILRYTVRMGILIVWLVLGLLILGTFFRLLSRNNQNATVSRWSKVLLAICGLKSVVKGAFPSPCSPRVGDNPSQAVHDSPSGHGWLWVANHISWLDIFVLNTLRNTTFVAKAEIRAWPVVGWLVSGAGTIFVERGSRHAIRQVNHALASRLAAGDVVGVFPEGTTTDGTCIRPFFSNLFEPAIKAGAPIQPVALRYQEGGRLSSRAPYIGEQSLLENLWCVLSACGVTVEVELLPPVRQSDDHGVVLSRHAVSHAAQQAIASFMQVPVVALQTSDPSKPED